MSKILLLLVLSLAVCLGGVVSSSGDNSASYIVGGNDTDISEVPYLVSLADNSTMYCGGAILSPKYIATAAHCWRDVRKTTLTVRAGSSDTNKGGVLVRAVEYVNHPKWDEKLVDYDVAVVELETPLNYSDSIRPIAPVSDEPKPTAVGRASGWGLLQEDGLPAKTLQSVRLPVVDRETCRKLLTRFTITERMICAGGEVAKDTCTGDSGGPLVVDGALAGVISFGDGCGNRDTPGVYANVGHVEIRSFLARYL